MYLRFLPFVFVFFTVANLHGQFVHESNIVLPLTGFDGNYGVAPAGEKGLVLYHEMMNEVSFNKRKWEVRVVDSELNLRWSSAFESNYNFVISGVKHADQYTYLMFQDTNIPMKSVFFVRFPIEENKIQFFQIDEFLPATVQGFEVLGNSLFVIGSNNDRPAILKFSFGDPRPTMLQGIFDEENEILHTAVNPQLGHIQITTRMKMRGKPSLIHIKQFDLDGKLNRDIVLRSSREYYMIDALASTDDSGTTSVVGTFAYKRSNFSNGIFTTTYQDGEESTLYYYDYSNLYRYFSYQDDGDDIEGAERKSIKGPMKINCVPRQLEYIGNELIFVGEIYENDKIYGEDYRIYSHALILGINANGKLSWDNSTSLHQMSSLSNSYKTYSSSYNEDMLTLFSDGFNIHYKIFNKRNDITSVELFEIDAYQPKNTPTGVGVEQFASIMPWYDNALIIYGTKTWGGNELNQRNFFYLDKVIIDPDPNQ
jgi:hypothetical protein